jgi:hypothetical protein
MIYIPCVLEVIAKTLITDWIAVLKEFQQLSIKKIIPGHGPVCDLNEVQVYLDFFEPVAKTMKELVADGQTLEEVVSFDGFPEFYASETLERRRDTLAQWYQTHKVKLEKL